MNTFYGENPSLSSYKSVKNTRPLGIFTKFHVMPSQKGLQRFHNFLLQDQSAKLLPKERVCNCLKKRIDKTNQREVKYNEYRQKAHWANVQRCASLWICPVCAKQISEKRREELKNGLDSWKVKHKGSVLLLTLTFSHSQNQPLKFLLEGLKSAMKRFNETTRVQSIFKILGVKQKINGLEVTYGQNGWHPHRHILLLTEHYVLDFKNYVNELSQLWIKACIKSGLNAPSMTHGLDLRDGSYAEKYVQKWGLEHELTKGHIKKGRGESLTPFDLLQLSFEDHEIFGKKPSKLWQEFGVGIKRQQMLRWGSGLKKLLEIDDKTDQELAEETEKQSILLRTVDEYVFSLLCHYQKRHHFLKALEDDWVKGTFGTGSAEILIIEMLELEIEKFRRLENAY